MPELPEVETTMRGIGSHIIGQSVAGVIVRTPQLRWAIPRQLDTLLHNQTILAVQRRAKYLLIQFDRGTLILHLGMSGSLRILASDAEPQKHDHLDVKFANGIMMRLRDPRRFGAVLWHEGDPAQHPLLSKLGVEPLEKDFHADYLYRSIRNRNAAIKLVIMDQHMVVGVGNIYANEALFRAGIRPQLSAEKLSRPRCARLVQKIQETLKESIALGGSSLRDFVGSDGNPGYFQQHYWVYGRAGETCRACNTIIRQIRQGQRSTFYCSRCQK